VSVHFKIKKGSVCGLCSGVIAKRLKSQILLISSVKDGSLGNTIDTFNLNKEYFKKYELEVIGTVFNKIPDYSYEKLEKLIKLYFEKNEFRIFGFVPKIENIKEEEVEEGCKRVNQKKKLVITEDDLNDINLIINNFKKFINFDSIFDLIKNEE
jgi:dethiobiotin synthetase